MLESPDQAPKTEQPQVRAKNPAAVARGRLGGLKGGMARGRRPGAEETLRDCGQSGKSKVDYDDRPRRFSFYPSAHSASPAAYGTGTASIARAG